MEAKHTDDAKVRPQEQFLRKIIRNQLIVIISSIVLNLVLLGICFFEWEDGGFPFLSNSSYKPISHNITCDEKQSSQSLALEIAKFKTFNYDELVLMLSDDSMVVDGWKCQDLALGSLVDLHFFDIERALKDKGLLYSVSLLVDGQKQLTVFPQLTQEDMKQVAHFVVTEKWPLTCEGIFIQLQKNPTDESLIQAFCMTDEFTILKSSIMTESLPFGADTIVQLALDGDFSDLQEICSQQKAAFDTSILRKREILNRYLTRNSKTAAVLFATIDPEYVAHKFSDDMLSALLTNIKDMPKVHEKIALEIVSSSRATEVASLAREILASYIGFQAKDWSKDQILSHYGKTITQTAAVQELKSVVKSKNASIVQKEGEKKVATKTVTQLAKKDDIRKPEAKTKSSQDSKKLIAYSGTVNDITTSKNAIKNSKSAKVQSLRIYCVQPGDSLWKIAKKFNIDIEVLRKTNNLDNDSLKPGTELRIPVYVDTR